jgi:anti-sigma regulatory factor (Ser/Thr protein kinase)
VTSSQLKRELSARPDQIAEAVAWVASEAPSWVDPLLLDTGLTEALTNAIVHGVLGVSSSSRAEDVTEYLDEVESRLQTVDATTARVTLTLDREERRFLVTLCWQGAACPLENRTPRSAPEPLVGSGLGTTLIHASFDEVCWSDDGRSVKLQLIRR